MYSMGPVLLLPVTASVICSQFPFACIRLLPSFHSTHPTMLFGFYRKRKTVATNNLNYFDCLVRFQ